jgi:hypothetical protein
MRLETLETGETSRVLDQQIGTINAQPGRRLEEGEHREPRSKSGTATGGQHVVRSDAVVGEGLGGPLPHEQGPVVADLQGNPSRVLDVESQVLRGQGVGHLGGVAEVPDQYAEPVRKGGFGYLRGGKVDEL